MFSKLFIKTKNMMINHVILSLCLGVAIALEILTGFAHFVPNVAKIISYVLVGITAVSDLITFILVIIYKQDDDDDDNDKKLQHKNTAFTFLIISTLMLILSCVIPIELGMFKG